MLAQIIIYSYAALHMRTSICSIIKLDTRVAEALIWIQFDLVMHDSLCQKIFNSLTTTTFHGIDTTVLEKHNYYPRILPMNYALEPKVGYN